ncbi:hypothetical protein G3A40_36135 [Paraburkholderia aspalathi]|uniref:hypothetical protein n=1 Tax=Paraburkholderia aspalathi TaxID=1324617 RepID=UPI00190A10CB|nr:hypothetical protein [Paraburkholderia aspalathi]MBK3865187.1 hypothetical protein [Paraburkholderia aspalathi]
MKGMKGPVFQIGIGIWFSLAATAGIEGRSWGAFFGPFVIGIFFLALGLAGDARRSERRPMRNAGTIVTIACAVIFVGAILNAGERLYLVNGGSYPRLLAHDLGAADYKTLDRLHGSQCKGESMEIYGKSNSQWVIRCGFSWVDGHTFISTTNPYADVLKGAAQ